MGNSIQRDLQIENSTSCIFLFEFSSLSFLRNRNLYFIVSYIFKKIIEKTIAYGSPCIFVLEGRISGVLVKSTTVTLILHRTSKTILILSFFDRGFVTPVIAIQLETTGNIQT